MRTKPLAHGLVIQTITGRKNPRDCHVPWLQMEWLAGGDVSGATQLSHNHQRLRLMCNSLGSNVSLAASWGLRIPTSVDSHSNATRTFQRAKNAPDWVRSLVLMGRPRCSFALFLLPRCLETVTGRSPWSLCNSVILHFLSCWPQCWPPPLLISLSSQGVPPSSAEGFA